MELVIRSGWVYLDGRVLSPEEVTCYFMEKNEAFLYLLTQFDLIL